FFTSHLSVRKERTPVTIEPYSIGRPPSILSGSAVFYGSSSSLFRRSGVLNILGVKVTMLTVLVQRMSTIIALMLGIKNEDEMMKSIAKDERVNWAKKVKYRLIPGIY
ncbi:hypothetical protein BDR03DRAFT_878898, partial [Suillus americanus]